MKLTTHDTAVRGREGGRERGLCSGRRGREVFPKQKLSFQLKCCLTCCHHQNSRRRRLLLHHWFDFYWLVSFLFFKHNGVHSLSLGGDGRKGVFRSASRELQELAAAPPPALPSFSRILWIWSDAPYWSSCSNWVTAAAAGTREQTRIERIRERWKQRGR